MNMTEGGWDAALGICFFAIVLTWAFVGCSCRDDKLLRRLIVPAIAWRLVMSSVHVFWIVPQYTASGIDATLYYAHGSEIAESFRRGFGEFHTVLGTGAIEALTGLLYVPFGASFGATYFFSAALGLGGAIYSYKAFALWQKGDLKTLYGILIFFLPSFTLWTSMFGKDSWIALALGLSAYGYSLWLKTRQGKGLVMLVAGLIGMGVIRPHIAVMATASVFLTYGWIRTKQRGKAHPKSFMALILVLVGLGVYGSLQTLVPIQGLQELFKLEERSAQGNAIGGSAIEKSRSPGVSGLIMGIPSGLIDVYVRPYPWEAHNLTSLAASLENLLMLVFLGRVLGSLKNTVHRLRTSPYFVFCMLMVVQLSLFLTLATNLGLISRQKSMLMPFLLAFLIGPDIGKRSRLVAVGGLPMSRSSRCRTFVPAGAVQTGVRRQCVE